MRRAETRLALALMVFAVAGSSSAAARQQARDTRVEPAYGTGAVSGVVVTDSADARPVRRAVVTLSGSGLQPSRGAITDEDGRFTIDRLPAGRFTISVMKAGYVSSDYGAKRPGRPGTAFVLIDGQHLTDLVVRLWRGAVLAGTLRDAGGRPVEGITVTAVPAQPLASQTPTLSNNAGATTDDRGEFRIFGLLPGQYVVKAGPASAGASPTYAPTRTMVDAILSALEARRDPSLPPPPDELPEPAPFTNAPIYYPGTASVVDAVPIALEAGQEATGLDFSLQRVPTARLTGVISLPDGQPAQGALVQLAPDRPPGRFEPIVPAFIDGTTRADGTFEFGAVPPGQYRLLARASIDAPAPDPRTPGLFRPGLQGTGLWADTQLSVSGSDVTGLALSLRMPLTLSGTLQFDAASRPEPEDLSQYTVGIFPPYVLQSPGGVRMRTIALVQPQPLNETGAFELENIVPGTYRLVVYGPGIAPDGWRVKSAELDGRDWLDGDVVVTDSSNLSGLEITLTDRHTELSGTLQTPEGTPVSDVFVLAFSADRGYWGGDTRRVQAVRPDVNGRYRLVDLPEGDYLLAALSDVDENEWHDPAFLERIVPAALEIAIDERAPRVQDLQLGGGGI